MSSNFGQIPSAGRTPQAGNGLSSGQVVKILGLPESLISLSKSTKIEGEVSQVKRDGIVRILTANGDVDVQVKGKNPPQQGQKVEIEIPAGRPPRQATLRQESTRAEGIRNNASNQISNNRNSVPTQQAPAVSTTRPATYSAPTNVQPQAQANPQAPVQGQSQTQAAQQPAQTTTNALPPLSSGQISAPLPTQANIRLLAVPPAQATDIAQQSLGNLTTTTSTIPRAAFTASLIADNAITQNAQALSSAVTTPTTNVPSAQAALQPALTTAVQPINTVASQPATSIAQIINTITQPVTTQTLNNSAAPLISQPVTSIVTPTSILPQTLSASNGLTSLPVTSPQPAIPTTSIINPANASGTTAFLSATGIQNAVQPLSINTSIVPVGNNITTENNFVSLTKSSQKIDIQILKISSPETILTPNNSGAGNTTALQNASTIPAKTNFTPNLISSNPAGAITAKVTGITPQGLPLITLQLPNSPLPQSFILQYSSPNIKLGTELQLSGFKTPNSVTTAAPTNLNPSLPPLLQGVNWATIDELYQTLVQTNPSLAQSLTRALPNPATPTRVGPAAMIFIAAMRSGDIGGWLGDKKVDLLQRLGRSNIINRISQETSNVLRTPLAETANSEWRPVPLPIFHEGEIQKIMLYTKHDSNENQQSENQGDQTRFVFDLTLSRMGDVQLDGLLKEKRLDLVVRTKNLMSQPMQETMRKAYLSALTHTSMNGDINFQGSTKDWVHVLQSKEQLGVHA